MDERERQIRELIKGADDSLSPGRYGPMWPTQNDIAAGRLPPKDRTRITESRVAGDMRKEMLDGDLDPVAAREMRKKLADQMYADMGLRGVTRFMGLKASAPKDIPEDALYDKADRLAAQALSLQRGVTQRDLERHANEPANYDPGRADFREIQQLGIPAGGDDFGGLEREQADELYLKRLTPPSRAMSPGEDGILWPYPSGWSEAVLPTGEPISWEEARVIRSKALKRESDKQARRVNDFHKPGREAAHPKELNYGPGREYGPQEDPGGDYKPDLSRFTGAASPKQPAYDTTTRSSADLDAVTAAEAAAAAALARRRAARRGNK